MKRSELYQSEAISAYFCCGWAATALYMRLYRTKIHLCGSVAIHKDRNECIFIRIHQKIPENHFCKSAMVMSGVENSPPCNINIFSSKIQPRGRQRNESWIRSNMAASYFVRTCVFQRNFYENSSKFTQHIWSVIAKIITLTKIKSSYREEFAKMSGKIEIKSKKSKKSKKNCLTWSSNPYFRLMWRCSWFPRFRKTWSGYNNLKE